MTGTRLCLVIVDWTTVAKVATLLASQVMGERS